MSVQKDTKVEILDLAEDLLLNRGFNGFSYAHISSALKIKNAAIHYYFPAKADLGLAIIQRARERFASWTQDERMSGKSAKEKLESLNPDIEVEAIHERITEGNVYDLVDGYAIVDAVDDLPTRFLLNRAALRKNLPFFHGAIYGFEGRATTIIPGKTACLRCLYQEVMPGKIPVVGVTPAVIGCIQATEVIKYILGIGELLTDRFLIYDGLSMRFTEVRLKKDPNCCECK